MKKKRSIINLLIVVIAAALLAYGYNNNNENQPADTTYVSNGTRIHFIDVGQGDCTLIESNGEYMLIDAGEAEYKDRVIGYLNDQNVSELKYIIATHPHSDHIGALSYVIDSFEAENIIMPNVASASNVYERFLNSVENKQLNVIEPKVGDNYSFGDCSFTIIAPYEYDEKNLNNDSVGIKLVHGSDKAILMGDAENKVEKQVLNNNIDIKADLYKASHHGSDTASSIELLNAIKPQFAVISCGKNNSYGHPAEETLYNLESINAKVYRTDESGDIVFESTGNGFNVIKGVISGAGLAPAA